MDIRVVEDKKRYYVTDKKPFSTFLLEINSFGVRK